MWLKSVSVANIQSYEKGNIIFSKGLNLIVGDNNSGKSTILKSIVGIQKGNQQTSKFLRNGEKIGSIELQLEGNNIEDLVSSAKLEKDHIHEDLESFENIRLYTMLSNKLVKTIYRTHGDFDISDLTEYPESFDESIEQENEFELLADREPNNLIYPFFSRKNSYYGNNIDEDSTFKVSARLDNITARLEKLNNPSNSYHTEFKKSCQRILGFEVGIIPQDSNTDVGIYTNSSETIPLHQMGEGVRNILGLLTILFTENNKVFLIEELENDIHPKALKYLLEIILSKSQNNQFIISTHSNIVLKVIGSGSLCSIFKTSWKPFFKRDNKRMSIPMSKIRKIPNTPGNRIKILEELGYDLLDFELWKGYLILEESSAESIINEILIPHFVPKLKNKLKTIESKGVSNIESKFHDFYRLFVFIHSSSIYNEKAWVLVDGDSPGKSQITKLQNKFRSWPKEHFMNLSKGNFEEYYPKTFEKRVNEILSLSDAANKRREKKKLIEEVLVWSEKNKLHAKDAFKITAYEVIDILKKIEKSLNKSN